MRASLYHLQINVRDPVVSIPFYRALFGYLEYTTIMEVPDMLGVSNGGTDFWVIAVPADRRGTAFHRKNPGLNHVCFGLRERSDVDRFVAEFMTPHALQPLYDSPRDYPEYHAGYYAVFFEDPDRLKIEVAHVPGLTDRRR
jgi:catechol 2,3-dioxygenase-like lactoylglutathione lyase family enzyme